MHDNTDRRPAHLNAELEVCGRIVHLSARRHSENIALLQV